MTLLVLRARRVFDGLASAPSTNHAVVVDGERIVAVGPAAAAPQGQDVTIIDLGDATLVPGFVDGHVHLTLHPFETLALFPRQVRGENTATLAARAIRNAQLCLLAGVTTVRDLGDVNLVTLAIRDAIAAGWVAGPRILASGAPITVTGGHCHWLGGPESDDVPALRRAVRSLAKAGVDWIKVMASGGMMTPGSVHTQPSYSEDELRVVVTEARRLGLRVAAHCLCTAAVANCVHAGVTTLEHCLMLDADGQPEWHQPTVDALVEREVWISPTFNVGHRRYIQALKCGGPVSAHDLAALRDLHAPTRRLREAGARFLFSSDAGSIGTRFEEFGWGLVAASLALDLDATEVLRCATRNPALAVGVADQVGALAPGLRADMVALAGDPWRDIVALTQVRQVWRGGRLVVSDGLVGAPCTAGGGGGWE
jgi:imidazolonepropionase-like amidohydrolase